jgi:hypothetical protein
MYNGAETSAWEERQGKKFLTLFVVPWERGWIRKSMSASATAGKRYGMKGRIDA